MPDITRLERRKMIRDVRNTLAESPFRNQVGRHHKDVDEKGQKSTVEPFAACLLMFLLLFAILN